MKFLADENLHGDVVAWLRAQGKDVLSAAESLSGTSDEDLLSTARREARVLVTDDKDFGELVFHRRLLTHRVVLIRLETPSVAERLHRLAQIWSDIEAAPGRFIVVTDRRVRVRGLLRET